MLWYGYSKFVYRIVEFNAYLLSDTNCPASQNRFLLVGVSRRGDAGDDHDYRSMTLGVNQVPY